MAERTNGQQDSTRQLVSSSSSSAATGNGVAPGLEFRAGRSNPQMMRDLLTSPHLEHLKDVIFRFEGGGVNNEASSVEFVGAHKTHLLTASPIFFQMLIGPNANARTRDDGRTQIRLPREYKAPAFRQLLQYIYCRTWTSNFSEALEVLRVASRFEINELACMARSEIRTGLRPENAARFLQAGVEMKDERLKELALDVILDHPQEVYNSQDFLSLSGEALKLILSSDHLTGPELGIFFAAIKWAEHKIRSQAGNIGGDIEIMGRDLRRVLLMEEEGDLSGGALYCIRFPLIPLGHFILHVRKSRAHLLTPEEVCNVLVDNAIRLRKSNGGGEDDDVTVEQLSQSVLEEEEEEGNKKSFNSKPRTPRRRVGGGSSSSTSGGSSPHIKQEQEGQDGGGEVTGHDGERGRVHIVGGDVTPETLGRIANDEEEDASTKRRRVRDGGGGGSNEPKRTRREEEGPISRGGGGQGQRRTSDLSGDETTNGGGTEGESAAAGINGHNNNAETNEGNREEGNGSSSGAEEVVPRFTRTVEIIDDAVPGPSSLCRNNNNSNNRNTAAPAPASANSIIIDSNNVSRNGVADWVNSVGQMDFSGIQVPPSPESPEEIEILEESHSEDLQLQVPPWLEELMEEMRMEEVKTMSRRADDFQAQFLIPPGAPPLPPPGHSPQFRTLLTPAQEQYICDNASSSHNSLNLTNIFRKYQVIHDDFEPDIRDTIVQIEESLPVVIDRASRLLLRPPNSDLLHFPSLRRFSIEYLRLLKSVQSFKAFWKDLNLFRLLLFTYGHPNISSLWANNVSTLVTVNGVRLLQLDRPHLLLLNQLSKEIVAGLLSGLSTGNHGPNSNSSKSSLREVILRAVHVDNLNVFPPGDLERLLLLKTTHNNTDEGQFMGFIGKCENLRTICIYNFQSVIVFNLAYLGGMGNLRKVALKKAKLTLTSDGPVRGLRRLGSVEELVLDCCALDPPVIDDLPVIFGGLKRLRFYRVIRWKTLWNFLKIQSLEFIALWGISGVPKKASSVNGAGDLEGFKNWLKELGLEGWRGCVLIHRKRVGTEGEGEEGSGGLEERNEFRWEVSWTRDVAGDGEWEWSVSKIGIGERYDLFNRLNYAEFEFNRIFPSVESYTQLNG